MRKNKTSPLTAKDSAVLSSQAKPVHRSLMTTDDLPNLGGMEMVKTLRPVVTLPKPHAVAEFLAAARVGVTTIAGEEFTPAIRQRPTSTAGLKL